MFDKNVNQAAIAALKRIYKAKGEAAFRHPHAIPAYLNDLLPGSDYEPCRRLIKSACENGAYEMLLIQGAGSMSSRVERAVKQLCDKAFLGEEAARCAVEWAACAVDPSYTMGSSGACQSRANNPKPDTRKLTTTNAKQTNVREDEINEINSLMGGPRRNAFEQASSGLEFEENGDGTCSVYGIGSCTDSDIIIPSSSPKGSIVNRIAWSCFLGERGIRSITIPKSVVEIADHAFDKCESLTHIRIPNSVRVIGYEAFYKCISLREVLIPDSVTDLGENAFCGCTGLRSVTLSNSLTSIKTETFGECSSLLSITIPSRVATIQRGAFLNCRSMTQLTIPSTVQTVGEAAFSKCSGLQRIIIQNGVQRIGNGAFYMCSGLSQITIPESIAYMGEDVFLDCQRMTITCKVSRKPHGWHNNWAGNDYHTVNWAFGSSYSADEPESRSNTADYDLKPYVAVQGRDFLDKIKKALQNVEKKS